MIAVPPSNFHKSREFCRKISNFITYLRIRFTIFLNITWFQVKNLAKKKPFLIQKLVAELFRQIAEFFLLGSGNSDIAQECVALDPQQRNRKWAKRKWAKRKWAKRKWTKRKKIFVLQVLLPSAKKSFQALG